MRARAGLDTEQLLPAGLALAGDSGDQSAGSVCMCWHGCEPRAQRVSGCTTTLTPEGGLHTQVCSLGGDLLPPQSLCGQGGCGSQGTTVAGRIQSCHRSEHHPGAANHGQHWGPPEWPRTLCPVRLSQAASCGFVSGHGARCITCLLVPRAGAGGDPVGRSVPRGFALRAAFPAPGKGCKQGPVPHPATLATQPQPLPWHCPGVLRPGRHGMPDMLEQVQAESSPSAAGSQPHIWVPRAAQGPWPPWTTQVSAVPVMQKPWCCTRCPPRDETGAFILSPSLG